MNSSIGTPFREEEAIQSSANHSLKTFTLPPLIKDFVENAPSDYYWG